MEIDRTARRILGALIEKRWTTPEQYPLTLNALVAACNQKSNRDPEMQLADFIIEGCLFQLRQQDLLMVVERDTGRAVRYSERLSEKLDLSRQDQAILAELMLRGPQTAGELYRRCTRMADFSNEGEVESILKGMAAKRWTQLMSREVGQRYPRWRHLFAPANEAQDAPSETSASSAPAPRGGDPTETQEILQAMVRPPAQFIGAAPNLHSEIVALREEIAELRARVARLESAEGATS